MTINELLSLLRENGATVSPPMAVRAVELMQLSLQQSKMAILPTTMIELYGACGALQIGDSYIYGPSEIARGNAYPIPSITDINRDLTNIPTLRGKTVVGRNALFWFATDAFGFGYMLDDLGLNVLRKYDNTYQMIKDCMAVGKI